MHDTCRVFNYCNCRSWVRYSTGMSTEAIVTLKVGLDCFFLSLTVITRGDSWSVGSNFSLLNASLEKKFLPNHVQSCKLFRKCSQFLPLGNPTSHPLFFHRLQFSVPVPLRTPPPPPASFHFAKTGVGLLSIYSLFSCHAFSSSLSQWTSLPSQVLLKNSDSFINSTLAKSRHLHLNTMKKRNILFNILSTCWLLFSFETILPSRTI